MTSHSIASCKGVAEIVYSGLFLLPGAAESYWLATHDSVRSTQQAGVGGTASPAKHATTLRSPTQVWLLGLQKFSSGASGAVVCGTVFFFDFLDAPTFVYQVIDLTAVLCLCAARAACRCHHNAPVMV
jgi:hypothetical protein